MELTNPLTERALLGCILYDNRILDEMRVTDSLFSDALNREVWREISKAIARGNRADLVELRLRMPDKAVFIAGLTDCGSLVNGAQYYADLSELSKKRAFFDMAKGIAAHVKDDCKSGQIADYCEKSLTEISEQTESGYKHVSAIIPDVIDQIEKAHALKGALSGIPTGFEKLDTMLNGWQPEYYVIGARPSTGKTAIALNCASSAINAKNPKTGLGYKVGFFSAEMSAASLIKRDISDRSSVDHSRIRSGFMASGDMAAIQEAMAELVEKGLYICDTANITKTQLISEARKMRRKEKVDIIFIDYIGLISNENKDIPRHEQIADISRSLKGLSRELGIPIVALSQVTRDAEGKRPTMANIRESGSIEQDSDGIMFLWDNGPYSEGGDVQKITLILAKQRNGPCGDIPLLFHKNKMRFRQAEVERW
ncbi:replicative DNA helicase [Candidatus Pacearchaeota archaeon]|jgi:replicative DNA helicase|nr:replicative DNA helicase [Candidatus Pacearchaeota archaeon]